MARSVADAAIALDAVSGYDPNDLVTALSTGNIPKSYTDYLDKYGLKEQESESYVHCQPAMTQLSLRQLTK